MVYLWVSYNSQIKQIISINSIDQLDFVMGKCYVMHTEFLSNIYMNLAPKG
jgi:hypothetical protein